MTESTPGKRFPLISIILFVLAALALLLFLYFLVSALSTPAAFNSFAPLVAGILGPLAAAILNPLKQAVSGLMVLLALVNLLVGAILIALGLVLRSHAGLAARVAALEAQIARQEAAAQAVA